MLSFIEMLNFSVLLFAAYFIYSYDPDEGSGAAYREKRISRTYLRSSCETKCKLTPRDQVKCNCIVTEINIRFDPSIGTELGIL